MEYAGIKSTINGLRNGLNDLETLADEMWEQHLSDQEIKAAAYQEGVEDMWKAVGVLYKTSHFERGTILNTEPIVFDEILDMDASEVLEKFKAFAEKKDFKVGEIVRHQNGTKGLVVKNHPTHIVVYVGGDGESAEMWRKENCTSTGHFLNVGDD